MHRNLIDIVCCPEDKAKLELEDEKLDDHGDILSGILRCTQCGFGYPVEDGIPNLLPPQYHVPRKGSPAKARAKASGAAKKAVAKGPEATDVAHVSGAAKPEDAPAAEREAVAEED